MCNSRIKKIPFTVEKRFAAIPPRGGKRTGLEFRSVCVGVLVRVPTAKRTVTLIPTERTIEQMAFLAI
jgi:hypothetical protein